jgi:CTP synthase
VGEPKSKPTQHGVKELRACGLSPDLIICRSTQPLVSLVDSFCSSALLTRQPPPLPCSCSCPQAQNLMAKISMFCMVPVTHVISVYDVSNIYKVGLPLGSVPNLGLVLPFGIRGLTACWMSFF